MDENDRAFLKRLRATFKVEADEHLNAMSTLLLRMEREGGAAQPAVLETLFREAHSLKGAARAVNLGGIENVCQALESVLAGLRRSRAELPAGFFDVLYRALDATRQMLDADAAAEDDTRMMPLAADTARALVALESELQEPAPGPAGATRSGSAPAMPAIPAMPVTPVTPTQPPEAAQAFARNAEKNVDTGDTIRIATGKLDALMMQAEEMLSFKFGAEHLASDLRALRDELESWRDACEKTARDARAARRASARTAGVAAVATVATRMTAPAPTRGGTGGRGLPVERWLSAAEREAAFAKGVVARFSRVEELARRDRRMLAGMVDNLLEDMKAALMLPFSSLLELFPRLVRDLARHSGKQVELTIDGGSLEIDRRILEQMKDPLIHLLRNAVDHGIEDPETRLQQGKPARGRVRIEIKPGDGNRIELSVADDGSGIDAEQVKDMAVKLGVISADTARAMGEREALALIFASGLSTSAILTDISGRGLGLAIVREKVEKLGGSIAVERGASGGTCFRMLLPTSLATFRGLLVRIGTRQFVLPSRSVQRVTRVAATAVKSIGNRDTITFDGLVIALAHLGAVLDVPHQYIGNATPAYLPVLVLADAGERAAFAVDEVIGDQEVLAKALGPQLLRVPNVAGATILGPGLAVPILHVADLLKSARRLAAAEAPQRRPVPSRTNSRSVLVAEDSITSRSLLQHVLQSAGYDVTTVVNGADALQALHRGHFDLVVSDVEMPRMDGFALTTRIRADARTAELPVVLVTSLESREQKERGVEAGANAYIVKSAFDRDNLLDVIRSLI